jgi:hypothetical protein
MIGHLRWIAAAPLFAPNITERKLGQTVLA